MLFGRKSCEENRDWCVKVCLVDDTYIIVTEQLNKKEAKEFYNELKKELKESKSDWVEIESSNGDDYEPYTRLFNKKNITHIALKNDN
jgi:hypothetical protein